MRTAAGEQSINSRRKGAHPTASLIRARSGRAPTLDGRRLAAALATPARNRNGSPNPWRERITGAAEMPIRRYMEKGVLLRLKPFQQ